MTFYDAAEEALRGFLYIKYFVLIFLAKPAATLPTEPREINPMALENIGLNYIKRACVCRSLVRGDLFPSGKWFSPPLEQGEELTRGEGNRPWRGGRRPTSVLTDSCSVGRMSSTLRIRSRRAMPTDCEREQNGGGVNHRCVTPEPSTDHQGQGEVLTCTRVMYCSGLISGMSFLSCTTTLTKPMTDW